MFNPRFILKVTFLKKYITQRRCLPDWSIISYFTRPPHTSVQTNTTKMPGVNVVVDEIDTATYASRMQPYDATNSLQLDSFDFILGLDPSTRSTGYTGTFYNLALYYFPCNCK